MTLNRKLPIHKENIRRRRRSLIPFLLISLLLHVILLAAFFPLVSKVKENEKTAEKPKYIEITEVPIPKEKETEPPRETKRLAERSHKAVEEKTRDDFTKKGAVASLPKTAVEPKVQQKELKEPKAEKKTEDKGGKKVASLPREDAILPKTHEGEKEALQRLSKRDLFSSLPSVDTPSSAPQSDSLGERNVQKKEDTVDLDTTEFKYHSYFLKLKRQIEGVWNYPKESVMRGEQGELLVIFTIARDGRLEGVRILHSSLHPRLDDEAIRAIRVAAPYSPFPESWGLERLNVRAIFSYRLGFWSLAR